MDDAETDVSAAPAENGRLLALSDGVFAIAATLLVFNIEAPATSEHLRDDVLAQGPRILGYLISFLLVATFWMVHHRLYQRLRGHDAALLWMNLLYLLTIAFLPFPAAILGRYGDHQFAAVFYALSMAAASGFSALMWVYVLRRPALLVRPLSGPERWEALARALITPLIFLLSVAVSFRSVTAAEFSWVAVIGVRFALAVCRRRATDTGA